MHPVTFPDPFHRTSQRLTVVAVIPARYASSRLPAKPLAEIAGRPMIEHVYRRAAAARGVDAVVVATDDRRIAAAVERFGGIARLTAVSHRTGTDRIAEIAAALTCEIVVNVQGDLPLVEPEMIAQVLAPLQAEPSLPMSTVCAPLTEPGEYTRRSVVKVVRDRAGNALYFSRAPIPFVVEPPGGGSADVESGSSRVFPGVGRTFKHIGLYAYRRDFLLEFAALPQTPLEAAESLEQLRALEHGFDIRVVETEYASIEIDTPEDLERVRHLLSRPSAPGADPGPQVTTRHQGMPARRSGRPGNAVEAFR